MHARELVELAAIISAHGPVFIRGAGRLPAAGIEQYWTASKCRLDRWGRSLKQFAAAAAGADPQWRRSKWPYIRSVLEEILTGEVLTRVYSAALCAHDQHHGSTQAGPVARSVMVGHLEARHRVLTLLSRGPGIDADAAAQLNHLRRRTERWVDLLLGQLADLFEITQFAVDSARASDFAKGLRHQGDPGGGRQAWPLLLASLRTAFRQGLSPASPNADLNAKIASSILSCFQPELFDSTGLLHSLWMLRLTNIADDAQGMVADLLGPEPGRRQDGYAPHPTGREDRLRRFGNR